MASPPRWLPARALRILLLTAPLGLTDTARAGDITAFVAFPSPSERWARGYGAAMTSTWFQVIGLEAEAARLPAESADGTMTTFTGSALLAPPVGFVTLYGGLGVGLFRQTLGPASDTGTLKAFILGAKLRLGLVVLKGEYRRIELSGDPLIEMDRRLSVGAGISF